MTRVFYDTEFIEAGRHNPIDLISIGAVTDDGREFYAINADAPWYRITCHPWLMANVVGHLPGHEHADSVWRPDKRHKDVKSIGRIRAELTAFLFVLPDLELWADYAAYDHVVLCQIFDRMIDLPPFMPMFTNDIQQEAHRLQVDPTELETVSYANSSLAHNALADAMTCRMRFEHLVSMARELGLTAPGDPDRRS